MDDPVEGGDGPVFFLQHRQDVRHRRQYREPRAPAACAVPYPEERRLAQHLVGRPELVQPDDALRQHERKLSLQPFP